MASMQRVTCNGQHATQDVSDTLHPAVWAGLTPKRAVDEYFCDAMLLKWTALNEQTEDIIRADYGENRLRSHTAHLDMLKALEHAHRDMEKAYKARGGTGSHQS